MAASDRAAKALSGASRNRPSRSMSMRSAGTNSSGGSGGGQFRASTTSDVSGGSGGQVSGSGGEPSFMSHVQSQYESLSEKLARENAQSTMASSSAPSSGASSGKSASMKNKVKGKVVRWAETARVASSMDADNASAEGEDGEGTPPRSPVDVLSDLFQRKYTLPVFLLLTTAIFLLVHLASGPDDESSLRRYGGGSPGGGDGGDAKSGRGGWFGGGNNRQKNVGQGDGFGDIIFSLHPTPSVDQSFIPTIEVIHHTTPKVAPLSGASPSVMDGNEPGWIIVPTKSGVFGGLASDADAGGGGDGLDDGGKTTLKWDYGPGVPTPDPALLLQSSDEGSKTTLKWNYGNDAPTPDPALLRPGDTETGVGGVDTDKGSPTTLLWNYPPGVPTPNPALLVEVAPPRDDGSPTTLKWGGMANVKHPVPHPTHLTHNVAAPVSPDAGSPTTLKWNFPDGQPTPDPALLAGVPDQLVWGYPPGEPTPDPVLLLGGVDSPQLAWNYPPGIPTPDPVLLSGVATNTGREPIGWGYPEGEPTPDPALLNGIAITEAPTKRNVETGLIFATPKPTPHPTKGPTASPMTQSPVVTMKVLDLTPQAPRGPPETDAPTLPPVDPRDPRPPARPKPGDKPERPQREDDPEVEKIVAENQGFKVVKPEAPEEPEEVVTGGGGKRPEKERPIFNGPNGFTVKQNPNPKQQPEPEPEPEPYVDPYQQPYQVPQNPNQIGYPGHGGYVVPLVQSSCGCCCCHCGGGSVSGFAGGMVLPITSHGYMQHVAPGAMLPQGGIQGNGFIPHLVPGGGLAPGGGFHQHPQVPAVSAQVYPGSLAPTMGPACPWNCVIHEDVDTMGRSNEDDALYEIFYTNPLNCCGTIVEIGAEGGYNNSTSYFFEKGMNWTAYLTEADPLAYENLTRNRKGDKAKTFHGAFCKEGPFLHFDNETRTFKSPESDDYTSEVMSDFKISNNSTATTSHVKCIRLDGMLSGLTHVNVMVIRVKGDPWAVIRTMDWSIRVDIWVILMEEKPIFDRDPTKDSRATIRASLKIHDYVKAKWDITLWCDVPNNCMQNEVWLRKNFNPIHNPLLMHHGDIHSRGLRGSN